MVSPYFTAISYLLASSKGSRERKTGSLTKSNSGRVGNGGGNRNNQNKKTGRKRYSFDGTKRKSWRGDKRGNNNNQSLSKQDVSPLPRLTRPNDPRLSYFTCRHTDEEVLIDEIHRFASRLERVGTVVAKSPYPGLVRVEDRNEILPQHYDPVYALQSMPNCVVVSGESIKSIANSISSALFGNGDSQTDDNEIEDVVSERKENLLAAPRGSLSIHALVPGQCKGQSKPAMLSRCSKITEELGKQMKKVYPAARRRVQNIDDTVDDNLDGNDDERWILQVMLQSPSIVVASIIKCQHIGPGNSFWPNWNHPLGLANVDISEKMPSSAYRKLMEALECMRIRPSPSSVAFDLGACPGGWTSVMRRLDCSVVSIDRSKLDPVLMNDEMVEFIKGDAFAFDPTTVETYSDVEECWMVSDVIAYPDKCTQLLDRWCGGKWARHMVVTMKFQGEAPSFDELDNAIAIVQDYGYSCRAKHFFNNKNEVTLMISDNEADTNLSYDLEVGTLGSPMYPLTLN